MGTILFKKIPFWVSFLSVGAVIYDLGFDQDAWMAKVLLILYAVNYVLAFIGIGILYAVKETRPLFKVWIFDFIYLFFVFFALRVTLGFQIPFFSTRTHGCILLPSSFLFVNFQHSK
ncbi:MAG: hypothetical protein IPM77_16525 [Crocinitomicaceae bacterium]|nr:hypothetical protein [Crocinitomicaceae bacterium]